MADISREVLGGSRAKAEDVSPFIPHQANQRIADAVAKQIKRGKRARFLKHCDAREHIVSVDPNRPR